MARGRKPNQTGYQDLQKEIRGGTYRNLYVLYGEETFLIEKLLRALEEALVAPGSRTMDRVLMRGDGQSNRIDLEQLQAEIDTPPFLSPRKLILVRDSGLFSFGKNGSASQAQKDRQARLATLLTDLSDAVCLIFWEEKVDRRLRKLVEAVQKQGALAQIERQTPQLLKAWVLAEAKNRKLTMTALAAENLIDRCDRDMQTLWLELDKIFLYCTYTKTDTIDPDLIETLSLPDLRGSIFDLTDALSAGKTHAALTLLATLIEQRQPVQLIAFMLSRHLRQLLCAAELGDPQPISKALKVMPFVAQRLSRQARKLPLPMLEALYERCFETDIEVKSGKISDRLGLELLLITAAEKTRQQLRY